MKLSVFWKVLLSVLTLQVLTAMVMVGWFLYSVRSEISQIVAQNAQETVLRSVEATEEYFTPVETSIQATQQLLARKVLERNRPDQLVRFFHDRLLLWPHFTGVYIGYSNGDFVYVMRDDKQSANGTRTKIIDHPEGQRRVTLTWRDANYRIVKTAEDVTDSYDPRIRPWYGAALEQSKVVWTEPYVFFTSRKPGVTAAIAVSNDGDEPLAVIGIDIELSELSKYLGQIAFGAERSAFIVKPGGDIVSHSDIDTVLIEKSGNDDKPRFLQLAELDAIDQATRESIVARLPTATNSDTPAVWRQDSDAGDNIVAVGRISSANWPWQIVLIRPAVDFEGVTRGSDVILFVIILMASAVAAVFAYLLAQSLGRPLATLWTNAKLAKAGNIELITNIASGYEEIDGTAKILAELGKEKRRADGSRPTS